MVWVEQRPSRDFPRGGWGRGVGRASANPASALSVAFPSQRCRSAAALTALPNAYFNNVNMRFDV